MWLISSPLIFLYSIFSIGILTYWITQLRLKIIFFYLITFFALFVLAVYRPLRIVPVHFVFAISFMFLSIYLSRISFKDHLFNRLINEIGKMSFSIYVTHFFIIEVLGQKLNALLVILVTIIVSWLIYRGIEMPMFRFLSSEHFMPKMSHVLPEKWAVTCIVQVTVNWWGACKR